MKLWDIIETKKGVILDIEGVLVSNLETGEIFGESLKFMKKLGKENKKFVLLTNLARISSIRVAEILKDLEFNMVTEERIINPTKAAIGQILEKKFDKPIRVFLISEGGHIENLALYPWIKLARSPPIDAILLGASRNLTYNELNFAFRLFKEGVPLIVLGGDLTSEGKFLDDEGEYLMEGAFAKVLEIATGKDAKYVGKPCKEMFYEALDKLQLDIKDVVMIGDSFNTDVIGASRLGIDTVWVIREQIDIRRYYEKLEENVKPNTKVYVTTSLDVSADIKQVF